jgi:hypothetical protein
MSSTIVDRLNGLTGSVAIKAPVECATTANITLSGEQTIDNYTTDGSRILVKNQTNPVQNGIYTTSSGSWIRTPDFDGNTDARVGSLVFVTGGTQNANTIWVAQGTDPLIPSQSSITFSNFNTLVQGDFLPVVLTGVATNDFVRFNGSNWVNVALYALANTWSGNQTFSGTAALNGVVSSATKSELTIASGVITPNALVHTVDTEGNTASDNLTTITADRDGQLLIISTADSTRDVVVDQAGNIFIPTGSDITLSTTSDTLFLIYRESIAKWIVLNPPAPTVNIYPNGTKLYMTAAVSQTNNTWTTMTFDTEEWDDGNWHDTATNSERVTVDFTGRVHIIVNHAFNLTNGSAYGVRIYKNATLIGREFFEGTNSTENVQTNIAIETSVVPTDYIYYQAFQESGGAVNTATGVSGCTFSVRRIK